MMDVPLLFTSNDGCPITLYCGEIDKLSKSGAKSVDIAALNTYLDQLKAEAASSSQHRQHVWEGQLAHYQAINQHGIEMMKSVLDAGREAINALILINGGAVVAILGFLGAVISKDNAIPLASALTPSVLRFGIGVLIGATALGVRYLSQACFAESWDRTGRILTVVAVLVAVTGYIAFGLGIVGAYDSFSVHFGKAH